MLSHLFTKWVPLWPQRPPSWDTSVLMFSCPHLSLFHLRFPCFCVSSRRKSISSTKILSREMLTHLLQGALQAPLHEHLFRQPFQCCFKFQAPVRFRATFLISIMSHKADSTYPSSLGCLLRLPSAQYVCGQNEASMSRAEDQECRRDEVMGQRSEYRRVYWAKVESLYFIPIAWGNHWKALSRGVMWPNLRAKAQSGW